MNVVNIRIIILLTYYQQAAAQENTRYIQGLTDINSLFTYPACTGKYYILEVCYIILPGINVPVDFTKQFPLQLLSCNLDNFK